MSIIISILALFVSAVSAYYTLLRHTEELSVVIVKTPSVALDRESNRVEFNSNFRFIFANTGNKPISILSAKAKLIQSPTQFLGTDDANKFCNSNGGWLQSTDFPTTIFKEGELIKVDAFLESSLARPRGADLGFSEVGAPTWLKRASPYYAKYCLEFQLVTPTTGVVSAPIVASSTHVDVQDQDVDSGTLRLQRQFLVSRTVDFSNRIHSFWRSWDVSTSNVTN